MDAGTQTEGWNGPSRRRVPRFFVQAPLDLTVLRSGVPDTLPGRSVNVCECGVGAIVAGELVPGESVGVELQLPQLAEPLRTKALVRHQDRLRCGLEFVAPSEEQRASIREWAREAKAAADDMPVSVSVKKAEISRSEQRPTPDLTIGLEPADEVKHDWQRWWLVAAMILLTTVGVWWWGWSRAWQNLEVDSRSSQASPAERPRAQVPAEVMQKLLMHRVQPVYPAEARKARMEGTIALDIVIGRDGSVQSMRALNGPDILARAAMDALRWWKFEPYRINGEPEAVETTVAVEFRR